jgi:hypothetical protein
MEVLARVLDGWCEWSAVYSVDEALQRLDDHPDLVICSLRFDESRMLELTAAVAHRGDVPFVCCRVVDTDLPPHSLDAAITASRNLGALAFVDFARMRRESGTDAALVRFRDALLATAA